jgi:hypothetical protein
LGILRKDFSNDENVQITNKLIKLVDEVGNGQDLPWLAEKLSSKSESRSLAWDAMLRIFKSSDVQLVNEWAVGLAHENHQDLLSYEQKTDLLLIAEQKALAENKIEMLEPVWPITIMAARNTTKQPGIWVYCVLRFSSLLRKRPFWRVFWKFI